METQPCHYLIEFLINLAATFSGVSIAIWADNNRERGVEKKQADYLKGLKEKLIFTLLTEIKGVEKFCLDNDGRLLNLSPYSLETKIIESTPEEQIKFLESKKLLYGLYELREHCRAVHQTIEEVRKNQNYSQKQMESFERWQANWQDYKGKLKELAPKIKKLLDDEYTGDKGQSEYRIVSS